MEQSREEHYRAALERIRDGRLSLSERGSATELTVKAIARKALAAGGALPAEDTETGPWLTMSRKIFERVLAEKEAAEARLEQIEPLVAAAIRMASPGSASDHHAAEQEVVFLARRLRPEVSGIDCGTRHARVLP